MILPWGANTLSPSLFSRIKLKKRSVFWMKGEVRNKKEGNFRKAFRIGVNIESNFADEKGCPFGNRGWKERQKLDFEIGSDQRTNVVWAFFCPREKRVSIRRRMRWEKGIERMIIIFIYFCFAEREFRKRRRSFIISKEVNSSTLTILFSSRVHMACNACVKYRCSFFSVETQFPAESIFFCWV